MGTKYIAFGAGPRVCIGEDLAFIQIILSLKFLLTHYKVKNISEKVVPEPQTTLMFKDVFYASLIPRNLNPGTDA